MKILRSQTIVPDSLYVERRADKQLSQIIAQMGRPGYVLVSRQMGKTNLLLHAKRRLQGTGDLFVYLDASNSFPDIRSFFRNIVDIILDTESISDSELAGKIATRRTSMQFQPHKEHEWELREVLRAIPGKLVIFVDEVDALSEVSYSDAVFSFFRSVFFSGRDNWPEFHRLNYVLSGVAEPSEIIKNKAVSPFNIGERIFLDDFDRAEFDEFVEKTGLHLPSSLTTQIFYWTNGNPRLSWDVCSAVEDATLAGQEAVPALVDNLIREMYFGTVDMPPVDHIKKLVEESSDLRDALVAVHYGKSEGISDKLRKRLYLAGIGTYDPQTRKVSIRNRILEEALREDYLISLGGARDRFLEKIRSYFSSSRYAYVIDELDGYLESAGNSELEGEARYMLGVSLFHEGQSSRALEVFSEMDDRLPERLVNGLHYYSGMASIDEKKYSDAVGHYRAIVQRGLDDADAFYYFDAALQLSKTLSMTTEPKSPEIAELSEMVIASTEDVYRLVQDEVQRNSLLFAAHMNMAHYKDAVGNNHDAIVSAMAAEHWARGYYRLGPVLLQRRLSRDGPRRQQHLGTCVQIVVDEGGRTKAGDFDQIPYDLIHELLAALDETKLFDDVRTVVRSLLQNFADSTNVDDVVVQLMSGVFFSAARRQLAGTMIATVLDSVGGRLSLDLRKTLCVYPVLADPIETGGPVHEAQLVEAFTSAPDICPVNQELYALYKVILADINHRNFERAERLRIVLRRSTTSTSTGHDSPVESLVKLLYDYLGCLIQVRQELPGCFDEVRRLLGRTSTLTSFDLPVFPNDFIRTVRQALATLALRDRPTPIKRKGEKIGRNELVTVRYGNELRSGKFKTFQSDLESGICHLAVTEVGALDKPHSNKHR